MHFLHENWWKILICFAECAVVGKFLLWYFDSPPKDLYRGTRRPDLVLETGKEDKWEDTIVGPPDAA